MARLGERFDRRRKEEKGDVMCQSDGSFGLQSVSVVFTLDSKPTERTSRKKSNKEIKGI